MAEIFVVETRGIGKPDYSKEISLGRVRPGLSLKYLQSLQIFGISFTNLVSPYPWIKLPLAVGGTAHLIDWETGLAMPYTCEAGYIFTIVTIGHGATQDHANRVYFSTPALGIPLAFAGSLGLAASGVPFIAADIVPFSTAAFDPTAIYQHDADFVVENLGGGVLEGSITIHVIKEAIGTAPPPPDKTVKCKWCEHEWVVPRKTTYIKCPKCGELNIYCNFSKFREL